MAMLGVYVGSLDADFERVERVTVPFRVKLIDELFNLRVSGNDVSCITLMDANHRPKSSRPLGGQHNNAPEPRSRALEMDRHFILTHGRSGSNFLVNSLNKHPSLVNYGEVLGKWTQPYRLYSLYKKSGKGWAEYLDALYSSSTLFYSAQSVSALSKLSGGHRINFKRKASIKSLGIKDFVFLLEQRGLMNYLRDRKDIKIIYLTRRNHFSRYLSLLNMQKTGLVKVEAETQEHSQYTIDIEDLLKRIEYFKKEEVLGDRLVQDIPQERVCSIEYEDYLSDLHSIERTHAMLFDFLGVEDAKVASSQRKILSNEPCDYIVNYAEVVDAMKQAGHEEYLT